MLPRKYQKGFVDPLSLFALGFLVVSLFVGTAVVSNPNFTLDIRQRAREVEDVGLSAIVKRPTPTPTRAPTPAPSRSAEDARMDRKEAQLEVDIPTSTPVPTTTSTSTTTPYCSRFNQEDCLYGCEPSSSGGTCKNAPATPTPTTRTTSPTPTTALTPTPTPYCTRFNQEDCLYGCEPTTYGGTCKTKTFTPTPTTPLTPTPTPYCSRFFNDNCIYGCEPTSSGGSCKTAAATPTLTPTPTTGTTPLAQTSPTPAVSSSPYCSSLVVRDCLYGCNPSLSGGTCKTAAEATPTPTPAITPAPDQYATAAFAAPENTVGEQIMADLNYVLFSDTSTLGTRLWAAADAITLGGLTNYGRTYAEVNQEQPQASYLQRSFSSEGLGASARLGGTLVGEFGGGAVALDALAGGTASLQAYTAVQTTVQTTLANAPSWVVPALRYGTVIAGNYGVYQGIRACQQDPGSDLCAATIVSGQLGLLDDLARETGTVVEDVGRAATRYVTRTIEEAQVAYAFNQDFVRATGLGADDVTRSMDDVLPPPNSIDPDVAPTIQTGASSVPETVTVQGTDEVITLREQIGSSGSQGSAYLGTRCTGETCVVKLFNTTEAGYEPVNARQLQIMAEFATPEQIASGIPLPEYYGAVVDQQGQQIGYAMEFIPGRTLREVIGDQGGQLTYQQATDIFDAVYTFEERTALPHGDISNYWYEGQIPYNLNTRNIMVTDAGRVVLIDPAGTALDVSPDPISAAEFIDQEISNLRVWVQNLVQR